jgi:hypothetical protein
VKVRRSFGFVELNSALLRMIAKLAIIFFAFKFTNTGNKNAYAVAG